MDEIIQKIIQKIAELCDKDPADITPDTKLVEDLEMKSPTMVILIAYLEDEFDVSIDFMKFKRYPSVGEAAGFIDTLMQ